MQKHLRFCFGTTIGIFSGGPKYDRMAALIIKELQKASNNSVSFVGVIGSQYKSNLDHLYATSQLLDHEQIIVNHSLLIPYRTVTHYKNYKLMSKLRAEKIYDDISSRRVDALITVGNFSLMKRLYSGLNEFYKRGNRLKPVTFGFDLLNAYRCVENQEFLDFLFYNLPMAPDNLQNYTFPSMCIGYEGLFKAFNHLNTYNSLTSDGSFRLDDFSYNISQFVKGSRKAFRASKGINEDHYITLFSPGDTAQEIKFSFNAFIPSLIKFNKHSMISSINEGFFHIFILLPENQPELSEDIKARAAKLPPKFKLTFIQNNDKYAAMCASDYALLHNGEVTVEAAVCQLPATVISNMSNYKAYLTYMFNGHDSPLNVSTNYEGYTDLLGSFTAIPEKISDLMVKHFQRPKLRYYYVKLYRQALQKMIMMSGQNPEMKVSRTGIEVAAQHILQSAKIYHGLDQNLAFSQKKRRQLLQV